jgi:hypothetical protein
MPTFNLTGGETLTVDEGDADELYDGLWLLVPMKGAISAAAELQTARASRVPKPVELNAEQSDALRRGVAALRRNRTAGT